jgi:hypothetical protein
MLILSLNKETFLNCHITGEDKQLFFGKNNKGLTSEPSKTKTPLRGALAPSSDLRMFWVVS